MRGAAAEAQAQQHLESAGLRLIARNWRCRGGELDLVMSDRGAIVFVEVRSRASSAYGSAAESINASKQARVTHAARSFLSQHPEYAERPARFDVVAFDGAPDRTSGRAEKLDWLRAAFDAE
jgi:putative endonuclease